MGPGGWGGGSFHADTHLLSDRGDTYSTSATWLYRQQDLEEKCDLINLLINELMNDKAVCRIAPATAGLLNFCNYIFLFFIFS